MALRPRFHAYFVSVYTIIADVLLSWDSNGGRDVTVFSHSILQNSDERLKMKIAAAF